MLKDNYENDKYIPLTYFTNSKKENLESRVRKENSREDKGFLKKILQDKVKLFREILNDIEEQIKNRKGLKDYILDRIDKDICCMRTKAYKLDFWKPGQDASIDMIRVRIEKEVEGLEKQKREETRECWRDIAILRKEHRELFQEYRNAVRRIKMVVPDYSKEKE